MEMYNRVYKGDCINSVLSFFWIFSKLKIHESRVSIVNKKVDKDGRQFCQVVIQ